ncbi:hypothetical protein BGZ58_005376 [Dissophora ornata]|nr:hypothetical protein BGZ58_005376 [Dissophora ornata]
MVSSKPLPPIPAPVAETEKDKERRSHLFSMTNLKRRVEATIAPGTADLSAPQAQETEEVSTQLQQSQAQAQPKALPIDTISSIFNSFISSSTLSASRTAATGSRHPSRTSTPIPPETTTTAAPSATTPTETALTTEGVKQQQTVMTLDQRSFHHLRAIARQSIASSCLEPEILWQRLFMDTIQKLATNASDAWQQVEAAYEAAYEGSEKLSHAQTTTSAANPVTVEKNKENGKDKHKEKEKEKGKEARTKPAFTYSIRLVKHVSSTQECSFTAGRFEGESILLEERSITERNRPPKDGLTENLLGGTITLTAGPEDLPKAEKILELLTFALCSLQLEVCLMRDHGVARPDSILNILNTYDTESRHSKPPLPSQQNALSGSKRASKGSMFFGWLSRGTVPAKYKKGTTQLVQDSDANPDLMRQTDGIASIADDFGMSEDLQSFQSYRFAKIIQHVEKAIISVSPDILFPPPHLLLRLRDEEAVGPDSKRKSYTWEDVEFVARKIGFGNRMNRSNTASVGQTTRFGTTTSNATNTSNVSKANRLPIDSRAGLDHLMTSSNSLQGIFNHQSISFSYSYYWSATSATPCNPPSPITVEYYRKEGQYEDMGLGEMIEYICRRANSNCLDRTCGHRRLEHISTYTHGEARINITVEQPRPESVTDFDSEEFIPFLSNNRMIAVWTRCKMCKARTKPRELSRASRLYSFGKYLELILYGQHFEPGPRPLCDHAVTKDAIARRFLHRGLIVTFEYESIDLFEMRVSRLQVHEDYLAMPRFEPDDVDEDRHDYSTAYPSSRGPSPHISVISVSLNSDFLTETQQSNALNATRLDILHFYESCKRIIVAMEEHLGETKSISKHGNLNNNNWYSKPSSTAVATDPVKKAALDRLDELGERWKADEFDLYNQLKRVSIPRLNDLRNRFRDCIKRTMRSMEAWQKEHHPDSLKSLDKDSIEWVLPDYINSTDYLRLVSSMLNHDDSDEAEEQAPEPPKKDFMGGLSIPMRTPLKTSRSEGSVTVVARKNGSGGSGSSTAVTSTTNGSPEKGGYTIETGAHGHYEDDDNDEDEEAEDDSFLVVDGYQTSVKFVQVSKVDFTNLIPNGTMSPRNTIGTHFGSSRHGKNSTLGLGAVEKKARGDDASEKRPFSETALPKSTPILMSSPLATPSERTPANSFFIPPKESRSTTPTPGARSKNTFGYHFTHGLSGTMKGLSLNSLSEKIGSGFSSYGASAEREVDVTDRTTRETMGIEQDFDSRTGSPHIKARFSQGKTSFSCIVYYAAEFDTLRRRCGIHQNYVESLSRCTSWAANGGKSKSSFYKTKGIHRETGYNHIRMPALETCTSYTNLPAFHLPSDDRFVVKQMVSSWNIAEKDELLKFAPKYFDYMERTHEAPTVLAKIFGFYTLKIKNGHLGHVLKIDVLVMEHLFFNQKITKTFDLKGIQDRHAGAKQPNAGNGSSMTLWDGDFIEGRYKALLLLHSHSKKIIRESLLNDTEFLAGANIMDYSLLVGVDDERKELVVGIVDFIGAYTWYKRIESKGKTTLRGTKDNVTVLPPQQYKTRFREAMERYFLAVPDKWSKTVIEQEQEAKKEATNPTIPMAIPEGSNESTGLSVPDLERSLKNKTSGYLEKMSKAILSSKSTDTVPMMSAAATADTASTIPVATTAKTEHGGNHKNDKQLDEFGDNEFRVQKLPRVFHPL